MPGFFALPIVLLCALIFTGFALFRRRRRRGSWRNLQELSPVSEQWLADRKRSG